MLLFVFITLGILLLLFYIVCALVIVAQVIAVFTTHAPFVSIPKEVESEIVKNLELSDGSILYDLGCGNASILKKAVEYNPHITAIGIEIAFLPFLLAKWKTRKYKQITIRRESIFITNIRDATHIYLYLYPKVINALIGKIRNECRKGTRIVSADFKIDSEIPIAEANLSRDNFSRGKKLFIYKI